MVFVETPLFRSRAEKLLSEDDLAAVQTMLMLRPDAGDVIRGSGGVRKVRVRARQRNPRGRPGNLFLGAGGWTDFFALCLCQE